MKYMKGTAETDRLIAERNANIAEIKKQHSEEAIEKCRVYYETYTLSNDPVTVEAAALNKEIEEINKEYAPKICASRVVATATEEEEAEARELWGEFYDAINAASERHPESFLK
jgi:hypothetical protein